MAKLTPLTDQARAAANAKATRSRQERAKLKRQIREGSSSIAQALAAADRDEAIGRLRVSELLQALPGVGTVRSARIMERLGIAPSRRLRGLGKHQRTALLEFMAGEHGQ